MVQLDEARFLSELTKLFQATRDAGSLTITHKRLQQRPKRGAEDATVETRRTCRQKQLHYVTRSKYGTIRVQTNKGFRYI